MVFLWLCRSSPQIFTALWSLCLDFAVLGYRGWVFQGSIGFYGVYRVYGVYRGCWVYGSIEGVWGLYKMFRVEVRSFRRVLAKFLFLLLPRIT